MSNGVCMRNALTGEITQLYSDISFGEAFAKVSELRRKNDGNYYWIGKVANHLAMK